MFMYNKSLQEFSALIYMWDKINPFFELTNLAISGRNIYLE